MYSFVLFLFGLKTYFVWKYKWIFKRKFEPGLNGYVCFSMYDSIPLTCKL